MSKVCPNDGGKTITAAQEKADKEEPLLPPGVGISSGYPANLEGHQAFYDEDDQGSHTIAWRA